MVTVKMKHTDRAMTQIWGQNTNHHCQTLIKPVKVCYIKVESSVCWGWKEHIDLSHLHLINASFSQDNTRWVVVSPVWRCWTQTRRAWPRPPSDSPSAGSPTLLVIKKDKASCLFSAGLNSIAAKGKLELMPTGTGSSLEHFQGLDGDRTLVRGSHVQQMRNCWRLMFPFFNKKHFKKKSNISIPEDDLPLKTMF